MARDGLVAGAVSRRSSRSPPRSPSCCDHVVAGVAERERDVLALLGQRMGDALRRLVDLLADEIADRGDVLRQIEMDTVDGVAHLLGLADQRVALVAEILISPRMRTSLSL